MHATVSRGPSTGAMAPTVPETIEETGIEPAALAGLALKMMYAEPACCTDRRLADGLKLPMNLTRELVQHLYREKFIEIRGAADFGGDRYGMLDRGYERAQRLLDANGYVGPAPVPLGSYCQRVIEQHRQRPRPGPAQVRETLEDLVLPATTVQTLGLVASSGRSVFMSGPPGNGKTSIARALHRSQPGHVWVPYAIDVDGQIIKVFDPHNHQATPTDPQDWHDRRWVKVAPPLVVVGGEMTIETMDLVYSAGARYYEAPFQLKANCGTLVIDDFGRQRLDPRDLLNRWIIPLEGHVDYLTLHTGKKIEVPFELLLIFATNLETSDLVDAAFLRRMGYRISVTAPSREQYGAIYRRTVEAGGWGFDPSHLEFLMKLYARDERPLRSCEPRDLVDRCADICAYLSWPRSMSTELLGLAWKSYFGTAA